MSENLTTAISLTVTLHGVAGGGYPVEIEFHGRADMIPAAIAKLREMGITPPPAATAPLTPAQMAQELGKMVSVRRSDAPALPAPSKAAKPKPLTDDPLFNDDGDMLCPHHGTPLREGRFGLFCASRAEGEHANAKGYCNYRPPQG